LKGRSHFPLQGDLPLVGERGDDPGDELQVVYPLHIFWLFAIPVADFPLLFIKREAFRGQNRPDHVFSPRSASWRVFALTLLWTEKPVCRQPMIFPISASEMTFSLKKRAKNSHSRLSW